MKVEQKKGQRKKVLLGPLAPSPRGDEGERKKMPQLRLSSLPFPYPREKKKGKRGEMYSRESERIKK